MPIRIKQKEEYEGDDYWSWSVWLDGSKKELQGVDAVYYVLHPTFRPSVIKIDEPSTKFRLDANGWGGFTIRARVILKTGEETHLEHELALHYPDGVKTDS